MGYTYELGARRMKIFYNGRFIREAPSRIDAFPYASWSPDQEVKYHQAIQGTFDMNELHVMDRMEDALWDHGHWVGPNHQTACLAQDFYKRKSVDEMYQVFRRKQSRWIETRESAMLRDALNNGLRRGEIKKIVALGTGSLHNDFLQTGKPAEDWMTDATAYQVSAINFMSRHLGEPDKPLPIFIQDPIFSSIDKRFLSEYMRFNIVENPDIFSMIDENTLVVSPGTGLLCMCYMTNLRRAVPAAMLIQNPGYEMVSLRLGRESAVALSNAFSWYESHNIGGGPEGKIDPYQSWSQVHKLWTKKRLQG